MQRRLGIFVISFLVVILGLTLLNRTGYINLFNQAELAQKLHSLRPKAPVSATGNYLAGYYSQKKNNMQAAADYFNRAKNRQPENPIILQSAYKSLLLAGKQEDAIEIAHSFLKEDPHSVSALILVVLQKLKTNQHTLAQQMLQGVELESELLRIASIDMLIMPYLNAWTMVGLGDVDGALAEVDKKFGEYQAFYLFTRYQRALMLEVSGQLEPAYEEYKKAIGKLSSPYHVVKRAGSLMERLGKIEEAKLLYQSYEEKHQYNGSFKHDIARAEQNNTSSLSAVTLEEGVAEVVLEAARVLSRGEFAVESLAYIQLARYLDPHNSEALLMLAGVYEQMQLYDQAYAVYTEFSKRSEMVPQVVISMAKIQFLQGEKEAAIKRLEAHIKSAPDDLRSILAVADMLRNNEQYEKAAQRYEDAIAIIEERGIEEWSIYFAAGVSYERAKQWNKAEKRLQKALSIAPAQPEVLNYLGYSWLDRNINIKEGKELIIKALAAAPHDVHIIDSMGWAHYKLGEYEEAVGYLERAIAESPLDPVINDHVGDTYWKLGREREAVIQWERAIEYYTDEAEIDVDVIKKKIEDGL